MQLGVKFETPLKATSAEAITIDNTSGGIGLTAPTGARSAVIQVLTANIRFCLDGTPPTTSLGIQVGDGDWVVLNTPEEITGFKAIREGSTSGVLQVHYS